MRRIALYSPDTQDRATCAAASPSREGEPSVPVAHDDVPRLIRQFDVALDTAAAETIAQAEELVGGRG